MLPMCAPSVRARLLPVLKRLGLPTGTEDLLDDILDAATHDKKCTGDSISVVYVPAVGKFEIRKMPIEDWKQQMRIAMREVGGKTE